VSGRARSTVSCTASTATLQRPSLGARLHRLPGLRTGERTVASITLFREAEQAETSNELAAQWIAEELQDFKIESMGRFGGEVMVSRAIAEVQAEALVQRIR
jgi:hypothetical protein